MGKTTATAQHINNYINTRRENNYKILSIVALKTLGQQHLKSFKMQILN